MKLTEQTYKLINPLKPDEKVRQEVVVSTTPQFDYSDCDWVAIDTEFLSLDINQDRLCVIQIASPDSDSPTGQRLEIVWVYDVEAAELEKTKAEIGNILQNENMEIIVHLATADISRLVKFAEVDVKAKIFDTKVSAKITITNSNHHGLGSLIQALIDPNMNKDKSQTSSQWDLHPLNWTDKMVEYAALDVYFLYGLKESLTRIAERRQVLNLVKDANNILPEVCRITAAGYGVNVLTY